ncbi:GBS Bsp-like repeat-containing protein, partial [Eubacterium sp.]|uniref:GBS Bsp-like repeat-containing protein n=1 Tax=Eubacterium sp. TaxID=142586 RepID=UPI002FC9758F
MYQRHENIWRYQLLSFFITIIMMLLFSNQVEAKIPTIVINQGHSLGYDSGAVGNGVQEAQINSDVAAKLANQLQNAGYTVYLTHPANGWLGKTLMSGLAANKLSNIGPAINTVFPDLALSIHSNAGASTASGYEFYWSSYKKYLDSTDVYEVRGLWSDGDVAYRDASPCAEAVASKRLAELLKNRFDGLDIGYRQTVERDDHVPANTNCASTLIETGFVTNVHDASLLNSDWFQNDIAARTMGAINDFFGGQPIVDNTPPTAESVTTDETETSNAQFYIYANGVKDIGSGVKNVKFPCWVAGREPIWYEGEYLGNNQWRVLIDTKDFNNQLTTYYIDSYATDMSGNSAYLGGVKVKTTEMDSSIVNGISLKKVSNSEYKIFIKGYSKYSLFDIFVWSENNGQDDLARYAGLRQTDGSYAYLVNTKEHHYDTGKYLIHIYAGAEEGSVSNFLGAASFYVPIMSIESVAVSKPENGSFDVYINGLTAPYGINNITAAVWSEKNGQDDLCWYKATKSIEGKYTTAVKLKNHHNDEGTYYIDIYGTNNYGVQRY